MKSNKARVKVVEVEFIADFIDRIDYAINSLNEELEDITGENLQWHSYDADVCNERLAALNGLRDKLEKLV